MTNNEQIEDNRTIEEVKAENAKFRAAYAAFIEKYESVSWGNDGDCGVDSIVRAFQDEIED